MKLFLPCLVSFLAMCNLAFSGVVDAEASIDVVLLQNGLHRGYNDESGDFVAVASSSFSCSGVCAWADYKRALSIALTKGRRSVMNGLCGEVHGLNATSKEVGEGRRYRSNLAEYSVKSGKTFFGFRLLAVVSQVDESACVVSVAVSWNEEREIRALRSLAGSYACADGWEHELRGYLAGLKPEEAPAFGEFEDSSGFVHFFGIDFDDVTASGKFFIGPKLKSLEMCAKSNLQLAMDGSASAEQETSIHTVRDSDVGRSAFKAYGGGVDASASGCVAPCRCVFDGVVESLKFNSRLYAIAYASEPSCERLPMPAERAVPGGVKVFNPITGKFETQSK